VTFLVFALAAMAWSLMVVRWTFTRRGARPMLLVSIIVAGAAAVSVALDVRAIDSAWTARRSTLMIRVTRQDGWWQLDYMRDGVAFTTANELHVPAGTAVVVSWIGHPAPSIESGVLLPVGGDRYALVARGATAARFGWHTLRVVADPPAKFEAWLRNESRPARAGSALFADAGCAYCHVIRGVAMSASAVAPELTHFASRATIAATDLPNRPGYLAGWIVNSRALKRHSEMPQNRLDPAVLHALTAYLESLR
jgi:cytochrome c oxidase subunit 2